MRKQRDEPDYEQRMIHMHRVMETSAAALFQEAAKESGLQTRVQRDFTEYLVTNELPRYVKSFIMRYWSQFKDLQQPEHFRWCP
jgi:hypothetical protein